MRGRAGLGLLQVNEEGKGPNAGRKEVQGLRADVTLYVIAIGGGGVFCGGFWCKCALVLFAPAVSPHNPRGMALWGTQRMLRGGGEPRTACDMPVVCRQLLVRGGCRKYAKSKTRKQRDSIMKRLSTTIPF